MSSYILSNANRLYTALEGSYGNVGAAHAVNRIPAVKLAVAQQFESARRRDKTGSRTFAGWPQGGHKKTTFELQTYMTSWPKASGPPAYGPLFQAALGADPLSFGGGTVAEATENGRLTFQEAHGLAAGQAVSFGGEVRFVAAIVNQTAVQLNAPFSSAPGPQSAIAATITYAPATALPSVSIFDYWSPATAVQRLLCGAAVDQMEIRVNGDYHEFRFSGLAKDILDSRSFSEAVGGLDSFPAEPELDAFDYTIVPGNLGQAWMGTSPARFFTLTAAGIQLKNNLETRSREFGGNSPLAIVPGERTVTASFDVYSMDDDATLGLYQAARQRSPISVMLQLGQVEGQVMAVYLQSVIPEVPEFDDGEARLQWTFRPSHAQGASDDEIAVAFG